MAISRQELESKLLGNVLDLRFVRRGDSHGRSPTRRMICTKSYDLLNTTNGRVVLNYRPPTHPKVINEAKHGVCVVWDVLMQSYRTVSMDQVTVLKEIPADDTFWKYFNEEVFPMTTGQKITFMDS